MPFELQYTEEGIFADYTPQNGTFWIKKYLEQHSQITLKKMFIVRQSNIDAGKGFYEESGTEHIHFKLGDYKNNMYTIKPPVLPVKYTLSIRKGFELDYSFFMDYYLPDAMIVVFEVFNKNITIGNEEGDISAELLRSAMKKYPGPTEYKYYKRMMVAEILSSEFKLDKDYRKSFDKYVEKHRKKTIKDFPEFNYFDKQKFSYIYMEMKEMLDNSLSYCETDWQERIMQIVKLIYPQYTYVTRESKLTEMYGKGKRVDFVVVNSSGYIDIIEIKDPKKNILATYGDHYVKDRNNYVPSKYLGNTVAQVENYILGLNTKSEDAIKHITKHFSNLGTPLPNTIRLKVLNPKGLIIMGRSDRNNEELMNAIELLRRQCSHIADIITYDDLLERLQNILVSLNNNNNLNRLCTTVQNYHCLRELVIPYMD